MVDDKSIEELRALLAKATPGPWRLYANKLRPQFSLRIVEVQGPREPPVVKWGGFDESQRSYNGHKANAALIVAMRNALPDLLDAAERLERQVRAKQQEIEEIAARAQENYERALAAERLASRAREDALREAIEICKEADAQDDRDNGAAATGAACNAANAILAHINKPKGGDANEGRSGTTRETRHPATSPGVTAGASAGWQPIETAPKDGTRFLTWDSYYGVRMGRAFMRADHDDWLSYVDSNGSSHKGGIRASHWMPLPAAPVDGGEK